MLNLIRIEMDRAFRNMKMYIALLAGCVVSILQVIIEVLPSVKYQVTGDFKEFPHTSFEHYIGANHKVFTIYYYLFVIILAAVPYAASAYTDRKTGYIKNIFTRTEKKNYYISKYVVAFVSAGTVAVVPQILNFLLQTIIFPSIQPYPGIGYVGLFSDMMWSDIYYKNAFLYFGLYLVLDFIMYGLINTIAVSAMWMFKGKIVFILLPFMCVKFVDLILNMMQKENWMAESFLRPDQPYTNTSLCEIAIYALVLIAICVITGVYGVRKKDNL